MPAFHVFLKLEWAWATPSLHMALELAKHMPCHHYKQFLSLELICHALITCSSGACGAAAHAALICSSGVHVEYIMSSVNAIFELEKHYPYPQLLLCIALYYFAILYLTSYYTDI